MQGNSVVMSGRKQHLGWMRTQLATKCSVANFCATQMALHVLCFKEPFLQQKRAAIAGHVGHFAFLQGSILGSWNAPWLSGHAGKPGVGRAAACTGVCRTLPWCLGVCKHMDNMYTSVQGGGTGVMEKSKG